MLPTIGAENCRVRKVFRNWGIQIWSSLHGHCTVYNDIASECSNARLPRRCWKRSIFHYSVSLVSHWTASLEKVLTAASDVERNGWIESKSLVQCVCKIYEALQVVIGRYSSRSDALKHLAAKLLPNFRLVGKLVHCPGQRRCCCVTTSNQDSKDLISDDFWIPRIQCNIVQECEFFVRLGKLL